MKKTRLDRQQDFLLFLLKPLVHIWMWFDAKRKVIKDPSVDFKRKDPYVMLANHTFLFDVVHVPLPFKKTPFIIASQTLFTKQPAKFLVSQVAHVIPKSKGKSDITTIKSIFNAVSKGYPILIFPEGDTTFYGQTGYVEEATMKLIKKIGVDVIVCNVRGGYLSKPRWATGSRKNRRVEFFYKVVITKEQLVEMTPHEIGQIVNEAMAHNAYEYQKIARIPHPGKRLAEGLENCIYVCPHCQGINTIRTKGNQITCEKCQAEGFMDKYGLIHGFVYDNLLDWDHYQRGFSEALRATRLETTGTLFLMNPEDDSQTLVGVVTLIYNQNVLTLSGSYERQFPVETIQNVTITLRRDLGFLVDHQYYLIKVDHYSSAFLRVLQNKY